MLCLHVSDITGATLCPSQDTPVCKKKGDNNLFFGVDVHIQQLLETFPSGLLKLCLSTFLKKNTKQTFKWYLVQRTGVYGQSLKDGAFSLVF